MRIVTLLVVVLAGGAMLGCGGGQPGGVDESIPEPPDVDVPDPAAGDEPEPDKAVSFTADVMPILKASCVGCHGKAKGLSLESHEALIKGGEGGPSVVPGDPAASLLVQFVEGAKQPRMPLNVDPLTDEQITTLRTWILQGAKPD